MIYYRSVHEVARTKYTQAQCDAWAAAVPDHDIWLARFSEYETFVARNDAGIVVAWIAMDRSGYIDMLFCLPEAIGMGTASALYAAVEERAVALGIQRLSAHASLLAQPFFGKHGWTIDYHEEVLRRNVRIPRAAMSKQLL